MYTELPIELLVVCIDAVELGDVRQSMHRTVRDIRKVPLRYRSAALLHLDQDLSIDAFSCLLDRRIRVTEIVR